MDRYYKTIIYENILEQPNKINYLSEFSKFMKEKNLVDPKLNSFLNENLNEHFNRRLIDKKDSEEEHIKVNLENGNHSEDHILKNIIKNNKNGKMLQNKRKRNENDLSLNCQKVIKRKSSEEKDFENNKNNLLPENTNFSEKDLFSNLNKEKETVKEINNDDNYSIVKSADSNKIISISGINNFNDEAFENIIKEFLNINDFPTESKEKINLLRKFISIYKKIKDDNTKLNNFLKKISEKLTESYDDIKILFEFEFLKNKREGIFTNLSKLIGKFLSIIDQYNVTDMEKFYYSSNYEQTKDKLNSLKNKIREYLYIYKEIFLFIQEPYTRNSEVIEKFNANFKCSRFNIDEGKDKILKKIKDSLDKTKVVYSDKVLEDIFIPKGLNNNKENVINVGDEDNSFKPNDSSNFFKLGNIGDSDNKSLLKFNEKQDNFLKYVNDQNQKDNIDIFFLNNDENSDLKNIYNNYSIPENSNMMITLVDSHHVNYSQNEDKFNLEKRPIKSRKYAIKQYNQNDFPEDDYL